jgi:hypothetical protein
MNTPWGPAQQIEELAPGIKQVCTASHGGIMLDKEHTARISKLHAKSFTGSQAHWEEDADWAVPFAFFRHEIAQHYTDAERFKKHLEAAKATIKHYHPEIAGMIPNDDPMRQDIEPVLEPETMTGKPYTPDEKELLSKLGGLSFTYEQITSAAMKQGNLF